MRLTVCLQVQPSWGSDTTLSLAAANERTFLHWMNTSVTIGSISAALAGEHQGRVPLQGAANDLGLAAAEGVSPQPPGSTTHCVTANRSGLGA